MSIDIYIPTNYSSPHNRSKQSNESSHNNSQHTNNRNDPNHQNRNESSHTSDNNSPHANDRNKPSTPQSENALHWRRSPSNSRSRSRSRSRGRTTASSTPSSFSLQMSEFSPSLDADRVSPSYIHMQSPSSIDTNDLLSDLLNHNSSASISSDLSTPSLNNPTPIRSEQPPKYPPRFANIDDISLDEDSSMSHPSTNAMSAIDNDISYNEEEASPEEKDELASQQARLRRQQYPSIREYKTKYCPTKYTRFTTDSDDVKDATCNDKDVYGIMMWKRQDGLFEGWAYHRAKLKT
eukprot:939786_1